LSSKYTCKTCQEHYCNNEAAKHLYTFDEEEFLLTKDENRCIFHCEKKEESSNATEYFYKKLNDIDIKSSTYTSYHFPNDSEKFKKHIEKKDFEIEFYDCTFNCLVTSFKNVSSFKFCTFNDKLYLGTRDMEEDVYCYECTFKSKVYFSENCEINGDIFENCTFSIDQTRDNYSNILALGVTFNGIIFKNQKSNLPLAMFKECTLNSELKLNKIEHIERLTLLQCNINDRVYINNCKNINVLNIRYSICSKKVEIKDCTNIENLSFYNTKFKTTIDLFGSALGKTEFEKTDFENVVVFENTTFKENVNFKFSTFSKLGMFKKAIFTKSLDLEDAIIQSDMNFYKITSEKDKEKNILVKNRETARIIKNSFERENNIIEANKYYALEMEQREEELKNDIKSKFWEWFVFKIHGISSNHSQDWVLALFWIISFTFVYSHFKIYGNQTANEYYTILLMLSFIVIFFSIEIAYLYKKIAYKFMPFIIIISFLIYSIGTNDYKLHCFSNNLNPFSIMTGSDELNLSSLLYKIIIAYLIYQFIVSVRQNTRRK